MWNWTMARLNTIVILINTTQKDSYFHYLLNIVSCVNILIWSNYPTPWLILWIDDTICRNWGNSYMFKNRFRQSMVRSIWCGQSCFAFGIIISIDKSWFRERNGNNLIRNCDDTDLASSPPENGAIWPLFTHSVCLFGVVQIAFKY